MNTSQISVIELIIKGTAVLLSGCGGAAFLSKSSASHRSLLWLGVFAALFVLPAALIVPPVWTLPMHMISQPDRLPLAAGGTAVEISAPSWHSARQSFSLRQWILAAYVSGGAAILAFRLLGSCQILQLLRGASEAPEAQCLIDRRRDSAGMRRGVRVLTSLRVTAPMTWGAWRPVIMLPAHCREWTADEVGAALQHEFTHICNHDALRRWLGTLVSALWWPHPLVWTAARSWRLEQERACDDEVINSGANAARYARQLIDVAKCSGLTESQGAAALIMATPAGLETRLR